MLLASGAMNDFSRFHTLAASLLGSSPPFAANEPTAHEPPDRPTMYDVASSQPLSDVFEPGNSASADPRVFLRASASFDQISRAALR